MVDPVLTTLVSAFAVGAAKGATTVGEKAILDAYAAFRQMIADGYSKVGSLIDAIITFEKKPDSIARRELLREELVATPGLLDDERLLDAAQAVLKTVDAGSVSVGVDWQDVRAAELELGQIRVRAGAVGFRAARMEISGKVTIQQIDAGNGLGNSQS